MTDSPPANVADVLRAAVAADRVHDRGEGVLLRVLDRVALVHDQPGAHLGVDVKSF